MSLSRRQFMTLSVSLPMVSMVATQAIARTPAIYAEDGIAIDGTDPVAYFTDGEPVAGSPDHQVMWQGATWQFSSAANRAAFEADPYAYAPQYGGYCAYAVSQGYTASTTPAAWSIVDGKLYLNYSRRIRRKWERDPAGYIAAGDANWPEVLSA
ncbi:YHS domain protein [Rhodobacteraceae bacterium S2214]|nr:YHS domain protein [Rhodobacteraceae bacterium S2214]